MPGFTRVAHGGGFRYKDARGRWVGDARVLERIAALAIPPAYTEVWICPLPNGHLQAIGRDARGRKQYRYHARWREVKDEAKFERLEAFGQALPRIRARVRRDLAVGTRPGARPSALRDTVLAAIVRLLDHTYLRVGNDEYASSNGSYGLTMLRNRHAHVKGRSLRLRFRGKSGVQHEAEVDDPSVVKVVRACQQLPGQELFQYTDEEGAVRRVNSGDVNDYLRAASGGEFTAKEFRTWHGTVNALELTRLACEQQRADPAVRYTAKAILGAVARQLGNTPAVCKKAYVHPAVLALGLQAAPEDAAATRLWQRLGQARGRRDLLRAEARLLVFLRRQRLAATPRPSRRRAA